jgi:hypothetical protein
MLDFTPHKLRTEPGFVITKPTNASPRRASR